MKLKLALLCALGLGSINAMASCYTVYDTQNRVVYNAAVPPVDMSRPIHETLPSVYPGGHMIFGTGDDCPAQPPARVALPTPPSKPSPLLTDRRSADAMHLRHTILPSGVALVSNPPQMAAGMTVVATATPARATVAPATLAQRTQRDTVITELHNPPLTVVQQGGMVVSELR